MRMRLAFVFSLLASAALAQSGVSVKQSGNVTPNTVPWWISSGVIAGGVTSADSPISSFGVTNNELQGICVNSDRITAAGRNTLCLGVKTAGGPAQLTVQNYGTAAPLGFQFVINGTTITPAGGITALTVGSTTIGGGTNNYVLYNNNGILGNIQFPGLNVVTPEQYYQSGDGADWGPAWRRAGAAMAALPGGGKVLGACGTTYPFSTLSSGSMIVPSSHVIWSGCGDGSTILKLANGVNTSSASFANGIYTTGTANGFRVEHLTLDLNGANNSCGGTCYHTNAGIGVGTADYATVEDVGIINNPGSNDTVFGTNVQPPTVTSLNIISLRHFNSGDRVNAASTDFSADFFIATNVTFGTIRYTNGPTVNGSAFEIHGTNIAAGNLVVNGYFNCGIIAAEPSGAANITTNVNLGIVSCNDIKGGIQVAAKSGATDTNINIHDINLHMLSGAAGVGIDACSVMDAASVSNTNLSISNIVYYSDVTGNLGNDTSAVTACRWNSISVRNITSTNTQAGAVLIDKVATGANITISGVNATNPGNTSTSANQAAVIFKNTSGNAAQAINIANVMAIGTVQWDITGNVNSNGTTIDPGSLAVQGTVAHVNWTGSSLSHVLFPVADTNFRQTGGTGQFIKQASLGGALTVSAPTIAEIAGLGTNVATWLATPTSANLAAALTDETGTGAAVFGTSPVLSTVDARGVWTTGTSWTLPAHTLGGIVSGGGNQINNVIIGTSTPLAGAFTTVAATTITPSVGYNISHVAWSATSPGPISAGFCSGASVLGANGTAAWLLGVGTSCSVSTGTLTMPIANVGWRCNFSNLTSPAGNKPDQTGGTTTSVVVTNYSRTTGLATNWTDSDQIVAACTAY